MAEQVLSWQPLADGASESMCERSLKTTCNSTGAVQFYNPALSVRGELYDSLSAAHCLHRGLLSFGKSIVLC